MTFVSFRKLQNNRIKGKTEVTKHNIFINKILILNLFNIKLNFNVKLIVIKENLYEL